jgi:hypothetical protein
MILRIWHGYTSIENSGPYEQLLKEEIFKGIEDKDMTGYKGIKLLKRKFNDKEFEFITIMEFDNLESVKQFMGEDYGNAYVLPEAQKLLKRYDKTSQHYDVLHTKDY